MSAKGEVLRPLDEAAVAALVPELEQLQIQSLAIGLLHAYVNPDHERRVRDILAKRLPGYFHQPVERSLRRGPRVRPLLDHRLQRLRPAADGGLSRPPVAPAQGDRPRLPALSHASGGGLATLETAMRFPIRLVELSSGPAGGAILAAGIAAESNLPRVLSFDMGGTTAKICLIDDFRPQASRSFEIGRIYRFLKGSGLPVRIPVIEMVEIGAGGGSVATVDQLKRLKVGPESAGAEPGPASYGRGGTAPTVTDADLVLGRIDSRRFAGGSFSLDIDAAEERARTRHRRAARTRGDPFSPPTASGEMVDENMANAARVHAIERGKTWATAR